MRKIAAVQFTLSFEFLCKSFPRRCGEALDTRASVFFNFKVVRRHVSGVVARDHLLTWSLISPLKSATLNQLLRLSLRSLPSLPRVEPPEEVVLGY